MRPTTTRPHVHVIRTKRMAFFAKHLLVTYCILCGHVEESVTDSRVLVA